MSRNDTKTKNSEEAKPWDDALNQSPTPESLNMDNSSQEEAITEEKILPQRPSFLSKKTVTKNRTLVINQQVSDLLDSIVRDDKGNRRPGSKGYLSKVVSNGILEELVAIEVIDRKTAKSLRENY